MQSWKGVLPVGISSMSSPRGLTGPGSLSRFTRLTRPSNRLVYTARTQQQHLVSHSGLPT